MNWLEFYSQQYVSLTVIILFIIVIISVLLFALIKAFASKNKIKTPWFEIGSDSIKESESLESNKTRLLLKRQLDFVDKYIDGLEPIFLNVEKELIDDAMRTLFQVKEPPKTHMQTCLVRSSANDVLKELKAYITNLLIMNHIGTDKEKIRKYSISHVPTVISIVKKSLCNTYTNLSGKVCLDTKGFWEKTNISDSTEWCNEKLTDLLINISELRYSDFDTQNIKINK